MSTELLKKFYGATPERDGQNIYELWEKGTPFGDSITPSGFSSGYVSYVTDLIVKNTPPRSSIVSLGSGNGFIEAQLAEAGYKVLCVDYNEEAVCITSKKGLRSICADFYSLPANLFYDVSLIYADGFFGHLYDEEHGGLTPALDHIKSLHLEAGVKFLVSNDAPVHQNLHVEPHASVPNFWYLSPEFLGVEFEKAGFEKLHVARFDYNRPVSGARTRSIYLGNHKNRSADA